MSMSEFGMGDEIVDSLSSMSDRNFCPDRMSPPSTLVRPSKLNLLKHRIIFSSAWFWRKFGLRLLRLSAGILLIYAIVFVLWFNDVVEKCRIPYHEELSYNSYFGGGLRMISKNFTQQLTFLPGLVCVPEVEKDYITATWDDFMDAFAHFNSIF